MTTTRANSLFVVICMSKLQPRLEAIKPIRFCDVFFQTEPPQRVVRSDECAYNTDEGEKNGCFIALDEDGH